MNYYSNQTMVSNFMNCIIENGQIYKITSFNERELIGYDLSTCNEALNKAEDYYNQLVEHGIIEKPKTQEDINKELLETIKKMNKKIEMLEGEKNDRKDSKNVGGKPKSSE